METILKNLESVLCDPEGKCCMTGSDADRAIVDEALTALRAIAAPQQAAAQEPVAYMTIPTEKAHKKASPDIVFAKPVQKADWVIYPLYTSPQVAQPVQQAEALAIDVPEIFSGTKAALETLIYRDAEAAHNIPPRSTP